MNPSPPMSQNYQPSKPCDAIFEKKTTDNDMYDCANSNKSHRKFNDDNDGYKISVNDDIHTEKMVDNEDIDGDTNKDHDDNKSDKMGVNNHDSEIVDEVNDINMDVSEGVKCGKEKERRCC